MKSIRIGQVVILAGLVVLMSSCSSSRQTESYPPPPPPRTSVSLIISPPPGMIVRYPNGRYYYRNPQGYVYWRGYDNRYYLDRSYMRRNYHSHRQYNDWKRYYRR